VFVSRRIDFNGDGKVDDSDGTDLYVLDLSSGEVLTLTADPYIDQHPRWSPDGTEVVFSSNRDGDFDLYVLDINNGSVRRATQSNADDLYPDWSPDGRRLVFISDETGASEVYTVSLSTGVVLQQTVWNAELAFWYDERIFWDTDWSPTNRDLVLLTASEPVPLDAQRRTQVSRLWLLDLRAREIHLLTPDGWFYMVGRWSPDGTTVVFREQPVETHGSSWSNEGRIVSDNSTYAIELSESPVAYGMDGAFSSWSPDGSEKVAVVCPAIGLPSELYIYSTAARAWTRVTHNAFIDEQPDWY
jgi:Tol biopolymer transport system component